MPHARIAVVAIFLIVLLASVGSASAQGIGLYGWGPRVGVADDPDQGIVGLHADLGEFVEHLRFQPAIEAGFGDDATIVSLQLPVHYRFPLAGGFTPYAGGGVILAFIDLDDEPGRGRRDDDSETELAPVGVGGLEWSLGRASDLFFELNVMGGDTHDAKLLVGWMFHR